jgi:hypothetical protein
VSVRMDAVKRVRVRVRVRALALSAKMRTSAPPGGCTAPVHSMNATEQARPSARASHSGSARARRAGRGRTVGYRGALRRHALLHTRTHTHARMHARTRASQPSALRPHTHRRTPRPSTRTRRRTHAPRRRSTAAARAL